MTRYHEIIAEQKSLAGSLAQLSTASAYQEEDDDLGIDDSLDFLDFIMDEENDTPPQMRELFSSLMTFFGGGTSSSTARALENQFSFKAQRH